MYERERERENKSVSSTGLFYTSFAYTYVFFWAADGLHRELRLALCSGMREIERGRIRQSLLQVSFKRLFYTHTTFLAVDSSRGKANLLYKSVLVICSVYAADSSRGEADLFYRSVFLFFLYVLFMLQIARVVRQTFFTGVFCYFCYMFLLCCK